MRGVEARGARAGARRVAAMCVRLAEAAGDEVPRDVAVTVEEDCVVLTGRRLGARSLSDARMRGIGMLGRRGAAG